MADEQPNGPPSDEREVIERKDVSDMPEDQVQDEIDQMLAGETPDKDVSELNEQDTTNEQPQRMVDSSEHAQQNAPSPNTGTSAAQSQETAHDSQSESDVNRRTSETQQESAESGSPSAINEVDDVSELDPADVDPAQLEAQEWTLGEETGPELADINGTIFKLVEPDDDSVLDIIGEDPDANSSASDRMYKLCDVTVTAPSLTDERWGGMKMAEKFQLMMEVSEYLGLQDMMDFQDVGPEARPA